MISKMSFPVFLYILCQANNFDLIFQIGWWAGNCWKTVRMIKLPIAWFPQDVGNEDAQSSQNIRFFYNSTVPLFLALPVPTLSPSMRRSFTRHPCTFFPSSFSSPSLSSDPSFPNFQPTRTEISGRNCWSGSASRNSGPASRPIRAIPLQTSRNYYQVASSFLERVSFV